MLEEVYENVSVLTSTFRIPWLRLEVLQQLLVNLFGNRKSANAPCFEHSRSGSDNMHVSGSVSSQPQTRDPRRIGFGLLSAKSTQHNLTKLAKCRSIAFAPTTFKRSHPIDQVRLFGGFQVTLVFQVSRCFQTIFF